MLTWYTDTNEIEDSAIQLMRNSVSKKLISELTTEIDDSVFETIWTNCHFLEMGQLSMDIANGN